MSKARSEVDEQEIERRIPFDRLLNYHSQSADAINTQTILSESSLLSVKMFFDGWRNAIKNNECNDLMNSV